MKAVLKSVNHDVEHELVLIARKKEIIILHENKEIATLIIRTMDNEAGGPTENFWFEFKPENCDLGRVGYAHIYKDEDDE